MDTFIHFTTASPFWSPIHPHDFLRSPDSRAHVHAGQNCPSDLLILASAPGPQPLALAVLPRSETAFWQTLSFLIVSSSFTVSKKCLFIVFFHQQLTNNQQISGGFALGPLSPTCTLHRAGAAPLDPAGKSSIWLCMTHNTSEAHKMSLKMWKNNKGLSAGGDKKVLVI